MNDIREFSTKELVRELLSRDGVKSTNVVSGEFSKVQVSGKEDKNLRYLKGYGPLTILEVEDK